MVFAITAAASISSRTSSRERLRRPVHDRIHNSPRSLVRAARQVQVNLGRLQVFMAQVGLQHFQIHTLFEHRGGVRMSERVKDDLVIAPTQRLEDQLQPTLQRPFANRPGGGADLLQLGP